VNGRKETSMITKKSVILFVGAAVVAGAMLGGYWLVLRDTSQLCAACHRNINAKARAVVEVDGRREQVCCVRCGLTIERQEHQPVRLVEVTDYDSGKGLAPDAAYYVEGSSVMLCAHHEGAIDQSKQPFEMIFDRCMPSVFAFSSIEAARAFASNNGGVVLPLSRVIEEVERR
jgi:hypothetical protein